MADNPILWIAGALVCMGLVFWLPTMDTWFVDFTTAPASFINLGQLALIVMIFWCVVNVISD